jgi:hypothetical protein
MATARQLREVFAPILMKHPDLVLHRRWLFRPPIETAIIGLFLDQSASPNDPRMAMSVIPLARFDPPWALGFKRSFQVERVIGAPAPGRWVPGEPDGPPRIYQNVCAPEYPEHLITNFDAKVLAFFDAVRTRDEVVRWVLSLRGSFFDSAPVELIDGWVAAMRGDFTMAADQLEAYFVRVGPPPPWIGTEERQALLHIQANLRTNDPTAIATFLHALEERTIAAHGLQRYWRRTPFPFER